MATSPLSRTVSGHCFCQRNKFTITPQPLASEPDPAFGPPPQLFYCNCSHCRRQHASPLVPEMRVPKAWITFTTHPQQAQESANEILKVNQSSPGVERRFCGFCGTMMSFWHNPTEEEAEILYLPVGTLTDADQEAVIVEMGLKPIAHFHWDTGVKWFQKLLEGSEAVKGIKFRGGVESEMIVPEEGSK